MPYLTFWRFYRMTFNDYSIQLLSFSILALWGWQFSKQLKQLTEKQTHLNNSLLQPIATLKTTLDSIAYQQMNIQQHITQENKILQQQIIQQANQLTETLSTQYETHFVDFIHNLTATINGENQEPAEDAYTLNPAKEDYFSGHYADWTIKRVRRIIQQYGANFFAGKRILDLGCGYGHVGSLFAHLGATVVYADARGEFAEAVLKKDPNGTFIQADLDNEFPFEGPFDLILNVGLLYHLSNVKAFLKNCCHATTQMVLETEVCNSADPNLILFVDEDSQYYDQSFNAKGSRPSPAYVEQCLQELGCSVEPLVDDSCNSGFHSYNWAVDDSTKFDHGLRKLWFVQTPLAKQSKAKPSKKASKKSAAVEIVGVKAPTVAKKKPSVKS